MLIIQKEEDDSLKVNLMESLNEIPGLTWTIQETDEEGKLTFLDLDITISDNKLHVSTAEKENQLFLYLQRRSAHPPKIIDGLIIGMIKRYKKQCYQEEDFLKIVKKFKERVINRGYSPKLFEKIFTRTMKGNCPTYNPKQ